MTPSTMLEFDAVTIASPARHDTGLWNATFGLNAGDLALVRVEDAHPRVPLADLALGLHEPASGRVRLLGHDWATTGPERASALRGRTGRVFEGTAWVSGLDVSENILLSQRYHSPGRAVDDLHDEATQLAQMFGLPGLPRGDPHRLRPGDLKRAACVRCFLGHPDVILLERPTAGASAADMMPALANAVGSARRRGAAVLWTTENDAVWADRGLRPTLTCVMAGAQLLVTRTAPDGAGPAAPVPAPSAAGGNIRLDTR